MNIRHSLRISAVVSLLVFGTSSAIELSVGAKAGLNLSKFYGADDITTTDDDFNVVTEDPYENQSLKPGFVCGGVLQMQLAKMFAIQPELLFTQKGEKLSGDGLDVTIKLNYLEVPVLFQLLIPAGGFITPDIYAGPAVAFKMGKIDAKVKYDGEEINIPDSRLDEADKHISTVDFGLALGGGIGIKAGPGKIILDARYTLGFVKIKKDTDEDEYLEEYITKDKNGVLSFSAGYLFSF